MGYYGYCKKLNFWIHKNNMGEHKQKFEPFL